MTREIRVTKTDFGVEREVEDWRDFLEFATQQSDARPAESAYLFRGQAKIEWPLIPSLLRHLRGCSSAEALEVEGLALEEFQRLAHLHLSASVLPQARNDLPGWWTLMQHYGAPTRVLDWTESPFIAAYFAVEKHGEDPGAIWCAHVDEIGRFMSQFPAYPTIPFQGARLLRDPEAPQVLYFTRTTVQTERMAAQQTAMSLSAQILTDHGAAIATALREKHEQQVPGTQGVPGYFIRLVIPARLKLDFLFRLRAMNITAGPLFPGIDGLGRAVTELVRLRAKQTEA